ncbi:MAG TPA: hypothetical protein PLF22_07445 [Pseudomonadales bacterium]|nr:hypothetical protein [Pseudomonadales bacterium]
MSENPESSAKAHGKQFAARMSENVRDMLLQTQTECTFIWQAEKDAMGTVMSFLWADGCVWLTTNDSRPRVHAIRQHGRATVVVSSAGTSLGISRCVTLRGACKIVDSRDTKDWFYPRFCQKLFPENLRAQAAMRDLLDRQGQVILKLEPDKVITYDGDALMKKLSQL